MGSGITVVCTCLLSVVQYLCAAVWLETREGAALALATWRFDSGSQVRCDGREMLASLQKLFMLLVAKARWDFARVPRQGLRLRGLLLAAGWGVPGIVSGAARCRGAVLSAGRRRLADTGPYLVWHWAQQERGEKISQEVYLQGEPSKSKGTTKTTLKEQKLLACENFLIPRLWFPRRAHCQESMCLLQTPVR